MNKSSDFGAADDPFVWLEDIESEASLAWVRERNARTESAFFDATFEADKTAIYDIATRPDQIPGIQRRGHYVYNFWQDASHKRGLWRRTGLESYQTESPDWEILLDVDALAAEENEDWVWRGCTTWEPEHKKGLIKLSRGGGDAVVLREFDLEQKQFVVDGFVLPEAKGSAQWLDPDTLLVSSALGGVTNSGYARTVRRWPRRTPFEQSEVLFDCDTQHMMANGSHWRETGFERTLFSRVLNFEDAEQFLWHNDALHRLDVPLDADVDIHADWLAVRLKSDWTLSASTWGQDALLVIALSRFLDGSRDFQMVFEPAPRRTLSSFSWTRNRLVLNVLDNLRSRVLLLQFQDGTWRSEELETPPASTVRAWPLDSGSLETNDDLLLSVSDYLEPTTLFLVPQAGDKRLLKSAPRAFEVGEFEVTRHEAVSVDGERIPYFHIAPRGQNGESSGPRPTILYGYGGFQISLLPSYLGATGKAWLEWGGSYVVANLRGGGEFGAAWHRAGMREGKALAHEDFAAVARDLIVRGTTTPAQLAAHGGSNGGLLVGNMLTRFPRLFGAIWCGVPLLDMKRYSQLLAGASWVSEYGDPENPDDWAFMQPFSPYHNLQAETDYPPMLLVTARHDDRVHPAHARKMAARLEELGHTVHFYEPDDGGGHGAANKEQAARLSALGFAFLKRTLPRTSPE